AAVLSHGENGCAAFAGAGASSASAICAFRESISHPVRPLSTLRTPRYRDARKTRSRPACSALDGPDLHWQAHTSFSYRTPLYAPPSASCRGLWDLSCRGDFQPAASHSIAVEQLQGAMQPRPTPSRPPEPPSFLSESPETPGRFSLRLDVYSPPQVLQIDGRLCHLVLAFPMLETSQMAGPLRSTDIPPLRRYYRPSRHPLVFDRLPGFAGYTAYL